jgi:hypothetical protein
LLPECSPRDLVFQSAEWMVSEWRKDIRMYNEKRRYGGGGEKIFAY